MICIDLQLIVLCLCVDYNPDFELFVNKIFYFDLYRNGITKCVSENHYIPSYLRNMSKVKSQKY